MMMQRVLAQTFAAASRLRMHQYDTGQLAVTRLPGARVISVGNIAVGGRGKTPLACFIASWYATAGIDAALLLRGYKGTMESKGGLVSAGEGPLVSAIAAGDEAHMASWQCPGVQVRVGKHRIAQGRAAIAKGAKIIVLDDGFQHRQLARDLNIVSVSPGDLAPDAAFFPKGRLRETPAAVSRADLLVGYQSDWLGRDDGPPVQFAHHPDGLWQQHFESLPLAALPQRVHLLCGIEVPERFIQTVKTLGTTITSMSLFRDHHRFPPRQVRDAAAIARHNGADALLTTAKDLARLQHITAELPIHGLRTRLVVTRGMDTLQNHLCRLTENDIKSAPHHANP